MTITAVIDPACDDADGTVTLSTTTYAMTVVKDAVNSLTWVITLS
jgi:hypothetical protein